MKRPFYARHLPRFVSQLAAGVLLGVLAVLPTLAQTPRYPVADLPDWEWQSPRPTGYTLQAVAALDDQTALVGGDQGTLLKTVDQGQTWSPLNSGASYDIKALSFISSQAGWLANNTPSTTFMNGLSGPGQVRKTTDGGQTWTVQPIGEADFVEMQDLRFFSAMQGYVFYFYNGPATGRPARLRVTSDGGQTWSRVVVFSGTTNLQFVSPLVGYFTSNGGVTKTTDGGQTFTVITPASGVNYNKVYFADTQNGWVGSSTSTGPNLFRTQDGGITWTPVSVLGPTSSFYPAVNKIAFADPLHGLVNNYVTSDGGQTWTAGLGAVSTGPTQLRSSGVGVSAGYSGTITTTTDFGLTGRVRNQTVQSALGFIPDFGIIHFSEPAHGWAMGKPFYNYNTVFTTHDRGTTWQGLDLTARTSGTAWADSRLTAGAFPDRDTAYVAGIENLFMGTPGAFMLRTVDAGQSWSRQPLGPVAALNDLQFLDGRRGIAVGSQGAIFYTRTGGASWLRATSSSTADLRKVCWASSQVAYALGDAGTLLTSQNGGQTWQAVASPVLAANPPSATWENFFFTSATTGFYVSSTSAVYRTVNGGQTWAVATRGASSFGRSLAGTAFSSATNGWAFGMSLHRTTDGGQTWSPQTLALQATAGSFVDAHNGWVAGENGLLIHLSEKFIQADTARTQRLSYCAGETLEVSFTTEGTLSQLPADYRVQVSNRMGRFRKGETLTLVPTAASSGRQLHAVLPAALAAGTRYRVRVVAADSSVLGGDNGRELTVNALATASISPAPATQNICQGSTLVLTASPNLAQYAWSTGATTRSITVSTAGTYTVRGASAPGCLGPASAPVTVAVVPPPAPPVVQLASGQLSVQAPVAGATYQWLLNNAPIPGATQTTYPASGAAPVGTYTVVATVNGCPSLPSSPLAVVLATKSATAQLLTLYPNPARTTLWLERPAGATAATVQLLDVTGRVVWQGTAGAGTSALPVQQVPAGLYLVRLQTPTGPPAVLRVVVEH